MIHPRLLGTAPALRRAYRKARTARVAIAAARTGWLEGRPSRPTGQCRFVMGRMIRTGRADATAVAAMAQQVSCQSCCPRCAGTRQCLPPVSHVRSAVSPVWSRYLRPTRRTGVGTTGNPPGGSALNGAVLDLRRPGGGGIPNVTPTRTVDMTPGFPRALVVAPATHIRSGNRLDWRRRTQ